MAVEAPAVTPEQPPVVEAPKLTPVQRAAAAFEKVRAEAAERQKAQEAPPAEKPPEAPAPAPTPVETPVPAPEKPPEEPLSAKFALVAKLERAARERGKAAKAREDAASTQVAEMKAKLDVYEKLKASAKLNPDAWAQHAGLTYDDYVQFKLNGGVPTPDAQVSSVRQEFEAFKSQQAEQQRIAAEAQAEREKAMHAQRYQAWQGSVVDFVKADAASYELIHQQEKFDEVPKLMQYAYDTQQRVLEPKEAAELVEKHLEQEAEKAFTAKKFQERFKPAPKVQETPAQPRTTTLSNGLTASTPALNGAPRKKTWADKREAALLAMENAHKP